LTSVDAEKLVFCGTFYVERQTFFQGQKPAYVL